MKDNLSWISDAYTNQQLIYQWLSEDSVNFVHGMTLSQFDMISYKQLNLTFTRREGELNFGFLGILKEKFWSKIFNSSTRPVPKQFPSLSRRFFHFTSCIQPPKTHGILFDSGTNNDIPPSWSLIWNFELQVYVPCILIVILSWVSFWIHR